MTKIKTLKKPIQKPMQKPARKPMQKPMAKKRPPIATPAKKRKSMKTSGAVKIFRTVAYAILAVSAAFIALYYLYLIANISVSPKLRKIYDSVKPFITGEKTGGISLVYIDFVLLYFSFIFIGIFGRKNIVFQILLPIMAAAVIVLLILYCITPNSRGVNARFFHPDFNIFDINAVSKGEAFIEQQKASIVPEFLTGGAKQNIFDGTQLGKFVEGIFKPTDILLPNYQKQLAYLPISFVMLGAQFALFLLFAVVFGTRRIGMTASGLLMVGFTFLLAALLVDAVLGGVLMSVDITGKSIKTFNRFVPVIRYSVYAVGYLILGCAGVMGILAFKKN